MHSTQIRSNLNKRIGIVFLAGGSGIHRPVKVPVEKKKSNINRHTGSVYASKKAGGDVKRKNQLDPYAYIQLNKAMYTTCSYLDLGCNHN